MGDAGACPEVAVRIWQVPETPRARTRRCSERKPAVQLRDKHDVIDGWLPSLTFALGRCFLSMTLPVQASGTTHRSVPKSPGALLKLVGTSILAGITCAMFGGGIALALGLSPIIAGSVSGTVAAVIVALVVLRYGQAA